jgi:hypothetical protein
LEITLRELKMNDQDTITEIRKRLEQITPPRSCCQNHWLEDYLKLDEKDKDFIFRPFIACSICGNKRCPKATDCNLECTGSNDVGQPGSIYS